MKKLLSLIICLVSLLYSQTTPGKIWSQSQINETNSSLGLPASAFFGSAIANIGDFDGDSIEDYAVGAEGYNNTGACWLVLMNDDNTVKSKVLVSSGLSLNNGDYFGCSVTGIGDFDNDGVKDIAVGAKGNDANYSSDGAVYLLYLNNDGTLKSSFKISSLTAGFTDMDLYANDNFGSSLAFLGDYNGDTYKEITVGANGRDDFKGSVWLLSLKADGTIQAKHNINSSEITDLALFDAFGSSVAQIEDLDSDGIKDLVVGAPLADETTDNGTGALYLIRLNNDLTAKSFTKISKSTALLTGSMSDFDQFGNALCVPGDIDKNGYHDIVAGAYQSDDGGNSCGAVVMLFMGADGVVESVQKISNNQGDLGYTIPINTQFGSALAQAENIDHNGVPCFVTGMQNFFATALNQGAINIINLHGNVVTDSVDSDYKVWGTVNPYGLATDVTVEYGLTTAYGKVTAIVTVNGTVDQQAGIALTDLLSTTTYHYRVKATNSRGFTYGKDKSFTTGIIPTVITTFPWVETFEEDSPSRSLWTKVNVSGTNDWSFEAGDGNVDSTGVSSAHGGALNARCTYSDGYDNFVTRLITPVFNLTSVTSPQVKFFYAQADWEGDINEFKVYYKNSDTGIWTQIFHDAEAKGDWTESILDLPEPTADYQIAFEAIDQYGWPNILDDVEIYSNGSSAIDNNLIPLETKLYNNYPNPFNPVTTIKFDLKSAGQTKLAVYNAKGEMVKTLINGMQNAGRYCVNFDGLGFNSGVYFYKLEADSKSSVKKMLMVK